MKRSEMLDHIEEDPLFSPKEGDEVHDDLTRTVCKIVIITVDEFGNKGIWLDNGYLDGGRHPWEISPVLKK